MVKTPGGIIFFRVDFPSKSFLSKGGCTRLPPTPFFSLLLLQFVKTVEARGGPGEGKKRSREKEESGVKRGANASGAFGDGSLIRAIRKSGSASPSLPVAGD